MITSSPGSTTVWRATESAPNAPVGSAMSSGSNGIPSSSRNEAATTDCDSGSLNLYANQSLLRGVALRWRESTSGRSGISCGFPRTRLFTSASRDDFRNEIDSRNASNRDIDLSKSATRAATGISTRGTSSHLTICLYVSDDSLGPVTGTQHIPPLQPPKSWTAAGSCGPALRSPAITLISVVFLQSRQILLDIRIVQLAKQAREIQRVALEDRFAVTVPVRRITVPRQLDAVLIRIVHVDRLVRPMVGRSIDAPSLVKDSLQRRRKVASFRVLDREVIEGGRAGIGRRAVLALPGVRANVMVVSTSGEERRLVLEPEDQVEAHDPVIEIHRPVEVRHFQVDMPDPRAGGNRGKGLLRFRFLRGHG